MTIAAALVLLVLSGTSDATTIDQVASTATRRSNTTKTIQLAPPSKHVPAAPPVVHSSTASQLTTARPITDAPASGSTRRQGRNTTTDVPAGTDRCDPQNAQSSTEACDTIIENRAAEFTPPDTEPLSAEQSLMASQNLMIDGGHDITSATRRLANGDVDSSNAGVAVSAYATDPANQPADQSASKDNQVTDAIIGTVIGSLQGSSSQ